MVSWRLLDEQNPSQWNEQTAALGGGTIYQTYEWGEYKRRLGSSPVRFLAYDEGGKVVAALQGFCRRLPLRSAIIWVPGGILGDLSHITEEGCQSMMSALGLRRGLLRASCQRPRLVSDVVKMVGNGWAPAGTKVNSGLSMELSLARHAADPLAEASSNWRHNYRRGQKRCQAEAYVNANPQEIARAYDRMCDYKGIGAQYSQKEISTLLETFNEKLIVYRARDEGFWPSLPV